MKYEPCKHCGEEIALYFDPDGKELWFHAKTAIKACNNWARSQAEPCDKPDPEPLNLPEPSSDGDTARDDLIGQLAMMQDFIDSLRNHMLATGKSMDLNEFVDLWYVGKSRKEQPPWSESVT